MSGLDPIALQVLVGGLRAACDEMGATLIRSAYSANIKERHDCSTALFDAAGELVMQAEHIPVHLGSMPDAVAAVLGEEQRPGRDWILNDPYRGGTHLPDITLVSPVFAGAELLGFAASRAHHADVGGPTPGSMPAFSRTLDEEGVVIPPTVADPETLERLAAQMRSPAPAARRSARAAGRQPGRRRSACGSCASGSGTDALRAGMAEILAYTERRTRAALAELPDGTYRAEDVLEADWNGAERDLRLRLEATIAGDRAAPRLRRQRRPGRRQPQLPALGDEIGRLLRRPRPHRPRRPALGRRPPPDRGPRPRRLAAQRPLPGAAVVAGNVETSSRVADLVLAALSQARPGPAQGQGTMNNLTLANDELHLLRDARRRPGRLPRRRRPERDPRRDVEHAEHADRGAGDRVPAAGARALAARAAAAARAATAAARASCARSKRWRRCASA